MNTTGATRPGTRIRHADFIGAMSCSPDRPLIASMLLLVLVSAFGALAAPSSAGAASYTYRILSKRPADLRAAMDAWSRSGANVSFRKAARGKRAHITWADHRFPRRSSTVGELAGRVIRMSVAYPAELGSEPMLRDRAQTAAHELGHFLGLTHRGGCSIMWAGGGVPTLDACGGSSPPQLSRCGPQRADVEAVARRLGWRRSGRAKVRSKGFGLCEIAGGPYGVSAAREDCQAATVRSPAGDLVPLVSVTFERYTERQAFQTWCTWKLGKTSYNVILDQYALQDPADRSTKHRPSGNCRGRQPSSDVRVNSTKRYLTVRSVLSSVPEGVLQAIAVHAEGRHVGVPCNAIAADRVPR